MSHILKSRRGLVAVIALATQTAWCQPTTEKVKPGIEPEYVAAMNALLGKGLSDPRGGTFSRVVIRFGNGTAQKRVEMEAVGWVLPGEKRVVLFDGLTYDIVKVIGPSDLETELNAPYEPQGLAYLVSTESPTVPALLLLAGKPELAEKSYAGIGRGGDKTLAMCSYLMGRYKVQAADCLQLRLYEEGLGWAKSLDFVASYWKTISNIWYQTGTDDKSAGMLLSDMQRRVDEQKAEVDLVAISRLAQPARITALIEALDEVMGRSMSRPGGSSIFTDPIVVALLNEGEDAIPELIETYAFDERFTRSVSFRVPGSSNRTISPVRNAAWAVLNRLWPSASNLPRPYGRTKLEALRNEWAEMRSLTEPERFLRILRSDAGTSKDWLAAAQYLTGLERPKPSSLYGYEPPRKGAKMVGEVLRPKHGAEILNLLNNRTLELANEPNERNSQALYEMADTMALAHCLWKWNREASRLTLVHVCEKARAIAYQRRKDPSSVEMSIHPGMSQLVTDLDALEDPAAAKNFDFLATKINFTGYLHVGWFKPLWRAPKNVAIQELGDAMFVRLAEEWKGLTLDQCRSKLFQIRGLVESHVLEVPSFRKFIVSLLSDGKIIGVGASMYDEKYKINLFSFTYEGGGGGGYQLNSQVQLSKTPSNEAPFSAGDFVALQISLLKGAPPFPISASANKKELAKAKLTQWLTDPATDWVKVTDSFPTLKYQDVD